MANNLPDNIQQFIGAHVDSIAQLEVLLLLRRDKSRLWTADEVAKSLYISPQMSSGLLGDLVQRGFAAGAETGHCYAVASETVDGVIGQLAQLYHDRRVAITSAIYSKPVNKAQSFADAFRLRKEK